MVITEKDCFFNPVRDMKPVEPFGFVDLQNALVNGVIESQIAESDEDYNGIEDPTVVIGKPRDIFDAIQAKMNIELAAAKDSVDKKDASE